MTDVKEYRRRADELQAELDAEIRRHNLTLDTLRHRTESHGRLVRDRLACPHCSTLPIEETPSE